MMICKITERNSLVKRATVEMKALNTLDAGAWRKRLPQVLGSLDDLVENLEHCFQMNIGYCILTNVLKHLFNNIILTPIVIHAIGTNIDEKLEQYESLGNICNCDGVKNVESDENQCN
ncbi:2231_t:CDS:2 [Entrophospora sp. SA101]|nr:2231_t:CDS:2 [Entrophospora sp. SA101]